MPIMEAIDKLIFSVILPLQMPHACGFYPNGRSAFIWMHGKRSVKQFFPTDCGLPLLNYFQDIIIDSSN